MVCVTREELLFEQTEKSCCLRPHFSSLWIDHWTIGALSRISSLARTPLPKIVLRFIRKGSIYLENSSCNSMVRRLFKTTALNAVTCFIDWSVSDRSLLHPLHRNLLNPLCIRTASFSASPVALRLSVPDIEAAIWEAREGLPCRLGLRNRFAVKIRASALIFSSHQYILVVRHHPRKAGQRKSLTKLGCWS